MSETPLTLALAFSGGGFRASSFSLGVLTYLNEVKMEDSSLLKQVEVLSTVSGGTITGTRYALAAKRGEPLEDVFKDVYHFMTKTDLIGSALNNMIRAQAPGSTRAPSLINAVADVYNEQFFKNAKFGELLDEAKPSHIKHACFNATEFTNALQFRFLASGRLPHSNTTSSERGIIGNKKIRVPESVAKNIRMADILAASSCFPGGFEPINFPTDFQLPPGPDLEPLQADPTGLMDGGIVDNQGIEAILQADSRMVKARGEAKNSHVIDLILIADVSSPYVTQFEAASPKWKSMLANITPVLIFGAICGLFLFSTIAIGYSLAKGNVWLSAISGAGLAATFAATYAGLKIIGLPRSMHVPDVFLKPIGKLARLKLFVHRSLLLNRVNSMLRLTNEVFLKYIRKLNYEKIFEDRTWDNRALMSAVYELSEEEEKLTVKIEEGKLLPELVPTDEMRKIASRAANMATTLWFTPEELQSRGQRGLPDAVIATGQFNLCWKLIQHIDKITADPTNLSPEHQKLIALRADMMKHWEKFKESPYWLVDQWLKKSGMAK